MSRRWKTFDRIVVTDQRCVNLTCDMCGREAEYPNSGKGAWEWGSVGSGSGELSWQHSIDGDYDTETVDLCLECAEKLATLVRCRTSELKQLLGIT